MRHWTQAELAAAARVSPNTISRMESRGVRDWAAFLRVCRALQLTPRQLEAWTPGKVDPRLVPLVRWFARLSPEAQTSIGHALTLLFPNHSHGS